MNPWKKSYFAGNWTDFIQCTSIGTNLIYGNHMSDNGLCQMIKACVHIGCIVRINFLKVFFCFLPDFCHMCFTCQLIWIKNSILKRAGSIIMNRLFDICRNFREYQFHLWFSCFRNNLLLESNQFFNSLMAKHNGIKDLFFRNFFCTAFHHEDCRFRTGNRYVHGRSRQLFLCWVDDIPAIYTAYTDAGNWSIPWNIGNSQRSGCPQHSAQFRRIILFNRQYSSYYMNVMSASLIKQRTNRTVNEACI